jgi:hypothetical protein
MRFAAFQVSGPDVTHWLYFNPATDTLFGRVPGNAHGSVELAVVATDAIGLTAEDLFSVNLARAAGHTPFTATVGAPGFSVLYNPPEPSDALAFHS